MAQNPIYNILQGNLRQNTQNGFWGKLEAFRRQLKGDPREQIQQMLNSGQVSQEQYNRAVQMANQLMQMFGK